MKFATKILSLLVLVCLATFYTSCGPDGGDDQTEEQKQVIKLVSKWNLVSAHEDDVQRNDFLNLVLELSGTYVNDDGIYQYKFTGTRPNPSPWPGSGNWKFGTNVLSDIIRDPNASDEISMSYTLSGDLLTIEFTVPDTSNGWAGGTTSRVKSVTGDWVFVFQKQP